MGHQNYDETKTEIKNKMSKKFFKTIANFRKERDSREGEIKAMVCEIRDWINSAKKVAKVVVEKAEESEAEEGKETEEEKLEEAEKVASYITNFNKDTLKKEEIDNRMSKIQMTKCKYGTNCYRKNPEHFLEFWHPPQHEYEMQLRLTYPDELLDMIYARDLGFEERNEMASLEFTDEELAHQISAYLNEQKSKPKLWQISDDEKEKELANIAQGSTRSGKIRRPLPEKIFRKKSEAELRR